MNREDSANHQGHYRSSFQNKRHSHGGHPGQFKPYQYEQGHWIDNQTRNQLLSRSAGNWHRTNQNSGGRNKSRRPFIHSREPPPRLSPPPKAASPPPKPKSPLTSSEEIIKMQSEALIRQMEECPDADLVLPSINATDNQPKEVTDENILPAIEILQAAADSNAAELREKKRIAKKAAQQQLQQANMKSALDIVNRIRQLKRQERVKVRNKIREVLDVKGNEPANAAVIPDISIKLEDLPREVIAIAGNILDADLEPLQGDAANARPLHERPDWIENTENSNSNAPGDMLYDPFDAESYDGGTLNQPNWDAIPQNHVQPYPENVFQTCPENNIRDNNFYDLYDMERNSIEIKPQPEFNRTVKCHIRPGRAESQCPPKIKLRRPTLDACDNHFNSVHLPQPVPPPTQPIINYGSPLHPSNSYNQHNECLETAPPPLKIGPQIPLTHRSHTDHRDEPFLQSETRKIRVIKEANETYEPRDRDEPVGGSRSSRLSPLQNTLHIERPDDQLDRDIPEENGFGNLDDEILFRANFPLGDEDGDWNRNIVVKSKKRVLKEIAVEHEAYINSLRTGQQPREVETNYVKTIETSLQKNKSVDDVTINRSKELTENLQTHEKRQDDEELDYEPDSADKEEDDECQKTTEDLGAGEGPHEIPSAETITAGEADSNHHDDANLPESETGTSIIVLEPTSQPGTYKAKKGKLVNEHLYCKNVTPTEDSTETQPEQTKLNKLSEEIQTEDEPVANAKGRGMKSSKLLPNHGTTHRSDSQQSSRKRTHSKSKSSSTSTPRHSKLAYTSSYKSKSKISRRSEDSSRTSTDKGDIHGKGKTRSKEVITKNQEVQTEPDRTDLGKLRDRYNRYKKNTRHILKKLNAIDKQLEDILSERRELCKALDTYASTSEGEEESPVTVVPHRRRLSEAGVAQVTKIKISKDGSTPSDADANPVFSDTPSEQVLTKVLHNEDDPSPDSPPNFLMHSMDMDIFSMISEPQGKATFNEPAVAEEMEIQDEQFAVDSNQLSQTEGTEMVMETELDSMMNIAETMPTDILEPSDNECVGESPLKSRSNPIVKLIKYNVEELQRIKQDLAQKSTDDFAQHSNNNVKIEEAEVSSVETDVISEFFDNEVHVNTEGPDRVDFVGWKGSMSVIKVFRDTIIAGNDQGKLYYFDTQSEFPIFSETVSSQPITSIIVFDNSYIARLFIGSLDSNLYIYDANQRCRLKLARIGVPIQCLELGWTGIYMGSSSGDLIKYCLLNGRMSNPVNIAKDAVLAIKCSVEGARRVLIVAIRNSPITIRDASSGLQLRTIGAARCSTVYSLVLHNNRIYCGTSQEDVLAFNFHDGQLLLKHAEGGGSAIACMTTLHDLLFVAYYNGHIYVYNTKDNSLTASLSAPHGLLLSMAVTKTHLIVGTKQNFQCMLLPASISSLL